MKKFALVLLFVIFGLAAAQNVTINYVTGNRGADVQYAKDMAAKYMSTHPNVTIKILQGPESATDRAQQYLQFFEAKSSEVDIFEIDVIWPGDMAEHFVNLYDYDGFSEAAADFFPAIVENNTVDGKLVAIPYFTDAGLLYYRSDLLAKYGFDAAPSTWAELEHMSSVIQAGERAAGIKIFGAMYGKVMPTKV